MSYEDFRSAILAELEVDLCDYGWLLSEAFVNEGIDATRSRYDAVLELVFELLESRYVEIGDAATVNDFFEFTPWEGSLGELQQRLALYVANTPSPDFFGGFWIRKRLGPSAIL
jgi:hypothetical protein